MEVTPNSLVKVYSGTVKQNLNIVSDEDMHFYLGCSTTFMGQMWHFGSQDAKRQVTCVNRNNTLIFESLAKIGARSTY